MSWIQFARIEMLFLIWAVPLFLLVYVYGMKKRRRVLSKFSDARGLKSTVPDMGNTRRKIKAGLVLAVLVLVAVALTGPRHGYHWQEVERKGIDIIIALDCSKSMLAEDISPTRLDRAKREVYDLLTLLEGDRVGLAAFAGTAFLQCPLTLDYESFYLFMKTLTPEYLPIGGSDLVAAVTAARDGFDETESEKAMILITDGENTGSEDPVKAAEEAKEAGIKIFCIGVGSAEGVPVPDGEGGFRKDASGGIVLTKLDEDTLKKMAVVTGGTYVRSVAGDMDLDAIYTNEIRGKMESATLESGRKRVWEDRFQWVLALAVLLLAVEIFLPVRKKAAQIAVVCIVAFSLSGVPAYAGKMGDGLEAYENGDFEEALDLFIEAQLDDPDKPEISYNIGNAYYKKGDFESAADYFKDTLKTEDKTLRQKAYYNLGNSEFRKGNAEEAVKNYEEALLIDTGDDKARQNLEFVKKVIEQQKQQQQQQDGEKSEDGEEKEGEDGQEQRDGEQEKEDGQQQQQQQQSGQENGDEKDSQEEQSSGEEQESEEKQPEEGEEGEQQEAAQARESDEEKDDAEEKQADRMLRRLKDQPGKAMIPMYRERTVEKDW